MKITIGGSHLRIFGTILYVITVLTFPENLTAQMVEITHENVYSEGRFWLQDNILYTDGIVVKFNQQVIDVPPAGRQRRRPSPPREARSLQGRQP